MCTSLYWMGVMQVHISFCSVPSSHICIMIWYIVVFYFYMCISHAQWSSRLLLLSDSEEKFADFLHDSKVLQGGALIAGEVKITSEYIGKGIYFSTFRD